MLCVNSLQVSQHIRLWQAYPETYFDVAEVV